MPDRDLITEGRRLLAEAGLAPWVVGSARPSGGHYIGTAPADPGDAELIGETAHAELIVHMRNTYGQLLTELEQARDSLASMDVIHDDVISELADVRSTLDEVAAALGVSGEGQGEILARLRAALAGRERPTIDDPRNPSREARP
ncbi:hypothetical protein [Nocardia sp. CC227C]|uniref:hypothetical protein n=1 Tax=Nocardia sp. CC227C TaxID=3044562 RepID=UPI00278BF7CE|nr:hypothetical protein [Nocardia sp. CC227C]